MKNEYKKYIYNLQKIDIIENDIKQKLDNFQTFLQNFEFKNKNDVNDMKKKYDEIVDAAKIIIDYLINELKKKSNINNTLINELLDIKKKLSSKSEFNKDKELIYKKLEDIYLNNWNQ